MNVVLEIVKQKLQAKTTNINKYDQRIEEYTIDRLLQLNQEECTNS